MKKQQPKPLFNIGESVLSIFGTRGEIATRTYFNKDTKSGIFEGWILKRGWHYSIDDYAIMYHESRFINQFLECK